MIGQIEANWVVPSDLASRIDAEYYQQHFIEAQSRLKTVHCVPFHTLWKESFRIYMGIKGYDGVADSHKFTPYLRPVDIDDIGFINFEHLGWCEANWLKDYGEQGTAKPNDLIVEVKGNTRKVAVLPATVPVNCIVSGSAWRIQISEKADRHFVKAFLLSETGQLLKRRQISNSIIPWIDPGAFKNLAIPLPDPKIQAYIGDKVRLAERCREEALISKTRASQKLKEQIQHNEQEVATHYSDAFEKLLGIPYCVSIKPELLSERLTAVSYNNNFLEFMALVDASEHVFVELGEHYDISAMIGWKNLTTADYVRQGIKMLRVTDISGCFVLLNDAVQVSSSKVDEQPQIHLQTGDVIFSKDGTLGIAAVMPKVDELVCAGSTLARLRKRTQLLDQYYLCAFLNSPYTAAQISYYISGIAQPHITQEYIKQIKVPLLPTSSQLEIGREFHRYDFMSRTAYDLISDAKSDIEKLVEGKLGVSELASGKVQQPTWNDIEKFFDDQSH